MFITFHRTFTVCQRRSAALIIAVTKAPERRYSGRTLLLRKQEASRNAAWSLPLVSESGPLVLMADRPLSTRVCSPVSG